MKYEVMAVLKNWRISKKEKSQKEGTIWGDSHA
jgi:hypothetical protein